MTGFSASVSASEKSPHSTNQSSAYVFSIPRTGRTVSKNRSDAARSEARIVTWSNTGRLCQAGLDRRARRGHRDGDGRYS